MRVVLIAAARGAIAAMLRLATQLLRGSTHRETTSIDVAQHLQTPQLAIAHAQHRHRCRPPQPAKKPGRLTFLNWTALTFARCAYRNAAPEPAYGRAFDRRVPRPDQPRAPRIDRYPAAARAKISLARRREPIFFAANDDRLYRGLIAMPARRASAL